MVEGALFACMTCARVAGWGEPKKDAFGMGLYCCGGSGEPVLCFAREDYERGTETSSEGGDFNG